MHVRTPRILLLLVWPLPRSLATTSGISVDFSSSPYLDVSVQVVPFIHLYLRFQCMIHRYCLCGLPHSDICGSKRICHSPQLFAACHVLHRLLVPRHSPCALFCLTFFSVNYVGSLLKKLFFSLPQNCSISTQISKKLHLISILLIFVCSVAFCASYFVLFSFQGTSSGY